MKRLTTILAVFLTMGCATYQRMESGGDLRTAALQAIGAETVAWVSNNRGATPSGTESLVTYKSMRAFIEDIAVTGSDGTVTATYRYTGTFNRSDGQQEGTLTVQRRLHFKRSDTGKWTQSAPAEEIARNYKALSAVS
jgi:hypothetical protein